MIIDVEPIIEQAGGFNAIVLENREEPCFFVVRLANGDALTTKWTNKEIKEFQPNKTVSEMMKIWEEGFTERYNVAKTALETGIHPTETVEVLDMFQRPTGEKIPKQLDKYEKGFFTKEFYSMEKMIGPLTFVKIVL